MSQVTSTNALAKDSTLQDVADAISTMSATSVGNLSALTTTDKTSLVGAVNEVKSGLTNVGNTVNKIATSGNIWYTAIFSVTAHANNYFAPLNALPAHTTATLVEVNELGAGALTLADFVLEANDEHSLSYIYTNNSDHAGKVCSAKIAFA